MIKKFGGIKMDFRKRAEELVSKMTLAEKISQMTHRSAAIERLGVPAYGWWNEALHGLARSGSATVFTTPSSFAVITPLSISSFSFSYLMRAH